MGDGAAVEGARVAREAHGEQLEVRRVRRARVVKSARTCNPMQP